MQSFTKILFERAHTEFHKNSILSSSFRQNLHVYMYGPKIISYLYPADQKPDPGSVI